LDLYIDMRRHMDLEYPIDFIVQSSETFHRRSLAPTLEKTIACKGVRIYGHTAADAGICR